MPVYNTDGWTNGNFSVIAALTLVVATTNKYIGKETQACLISVHFLRTWLVPVVF